MRNAWLTSSAACRRCLSSVLERPTPLDVSNLRVEGHGLPMNVAALVMFESGQLLDASGQLALDAIRARIEGRLHLAPRLRQRLYWPGLGLGPPVWVDDASFEIARHVRTRTLPAGGDETALLAACVELNDRPFDRAHPLWEIWFLTEGLEGRVSMLVRFHHVLADGLAALVLLGVLFDSRVRPRRRRAPRGRLGRCRPGPSFCSTTWARSTGARRAGPYRPSSATARARQNAAAPGRTAGW